MHELLTETFKCSDGMPVFVAQPRQPGSYPIVILMH